MAGHVIHGQMAMVETFEPHRAHRVKTRRQCRGSGAANFRPSRVAVLKRWAAFIVGVHKD
jgi:hypothetical protein